MEMYQNLGNFLDNYGSPFFVGSLLEKKVLFVNKEAKRIFHCTEETCDFEKIFEGTEERIETLIAKGLQSGKNSIFYNFIVNTGEKEKIVVDFQFGFFNDEKTAIFLEIIPQQDTRLQMAQNQIRHSPRAEAILNFDENLSIVDCNEAFYKVFESSEELRHSHFKNDLVNGFSPKTRERLMEKVHETLKTSEIFSTEIKVFTANGEEKWYRFDLQKRNLDNAGIKLMCQMVNIEKEVRRKEENYVLNQYLTIMQESSPDILYRVDINENTMYHYSDLIPVGGKGRVIADFVGVFMSGKIIHPDDREAYLQGFKSFYNEDITLDIPIRFSFDGGEYGWYRIVGKKIYDSQGELVEVFGALLNVDSEVHLQEEVSTLNKYFDILNDITDESLYFYDIKTEKLRLGGLTEKEIGLPKEVDHYPESIYPYVHPDDLENFKKFDERALNSWNNRMELRLKNVDGTYQWYELLSDIICDDDGNPTEIFGKIKNIQSKYELKHEIAEANNYLMVMQELSDDVLYRIDMETMTLHYTIKMPDGTIVTNTLENYPDSTFDTDLVHPEDHNLIRQQQKSWFAGKMEEYKVRFKLTSDDYQWYSDNAIKICDKQGNIKEIYGRLKDIHAQETMVAEVSTLNQYVEAVQSLSGESLFYVDMKSLILRQRGEVAVELGLPDEMHHYPEGAYPYIHGDDLENYQIYAKDTMDGKVSSVQCRVRTTTGEYQWYEIISKPIYDKTGAFIEIFGRMTNINKEMTIKADYSALNQYFNAMQNLSQNILFHIDMKTKTFKHANKNAQGFGVPLEIPNYVDTFIESGFVRPEDEAKYREYAEKLISGENMEYEIQAAVDVGVYEWFHITSQYIYNEAGDAVEIFGMMENIQEKKDLEKKASHDLMTKVLNKVSFEEKSEVIMLKLHPEKQHALIFIDLDDFKGVNDKLGHNYGDILLTTVGERLKRLVREGDLVGRIGGDEFAVLLCNIGDENSVLERINYMLESVTRNFYHEGISVGIRTSVGVAVYPSHGTSYKDLIGKADIAVYESKRKGKNIATLYSEEMGKY